MSEHHYHFHVHIDPINIEAKATLKIKNESDDLSASGEAALLRAKSSTKKADESGEDAQAESKKLDDIISS